MQGERKVIRSALKQALQNALTLNVFARRFIDARGLDQYINVYFDEGDIEFEGLDKSTTALVIVGYHTRDYVDDDQLDDIADTIYAAIENAPNLTGVRGLLPAGFKYGEEQEQEFTSIYQTFTVVY